MKVAKCQDAGLNVILCIGETLEERGGLKGFRGCSLLEKRPQPFLGHLHAMKSGKYQKRAGWGESWCLEVLVEAS